MLRLNSKLLKIFILQFVVITIGLLGMPFVSMAQVKNIEQLRRLSQRYPDSAMVLLKKSYSQALTENEKEKEGLCLQQMGWICFSQGHYQLALEYYLDADKIFGTLNKPDLMASNLNDIGLFYYYNKQSNLAREHYNRALELLKKTKNRAGMAETFGNIGHLYEKKHQYDSAFYYQHLALQNFTAIKDHDGSAKIYENLGSIYEDLEKYDSAAVYFNKSLALYQETKNEIGSVEVVNNLGDLLRKTGKYLQSIAKTKEAYQMALDLGNSYQLAATTKDLAKTFALMGKMDSAYHYAELSRKHTLDIYSLDGIKQASFLQVLYDMDKKSDEIKELQVNRRMNQTIIVASLIVLALLVVLSVTFYSRQRLKIKEQQAEAKQKQIESELLASRIKNQDLEEEKLKEQLELKSRELSAHTLNLIRNNQFLEHMRTSLQALVKDEKRDQKRQMQKLIVEINESIAQEQYWKEFIQAFEQVHQSFFEKLKEKSKDLTAADIRLIALLKINLNSTDISTLLGISTDSLRVARYRLRKKLNIPQGGNLTTFVQSI
ncbi:tetratricopeptide repeat protein [Pedobacter sp.]|uniref:tetratricopeptide repeat protein n=1 Tax=Pedobacter sp. TaxID=1411316 RepID=UPI00396C7D36